MRPQAPHDPSVELMKEPANVGTTIVVPPSANDRVDFSNQLLRRKGSFPTRSLPNLILEMLERLLPRIRVQVPLRGPSTDLVGCKPQPTASPLDLVSQKLESMLHVHDLSLLGMKRNTELLKNLASNPQRSLCFRPRSARHHPVIRVTRQAIPPTTHLPIERCQKNVTQERRNDSSYAKDNLGRNPLESWESNVGSRRVQAPRALL